MSIKIICISLVVVLVAGGFYILYLESKITKLNSEIAGLKHQINIKINTEIVNLKNQINMLLQKKDVATQE